MQDGAALAVILVVGLELRLLALELVQARVNVGDEAVDALARLVRVVHQLQAVGAALLIDARPRDLLEHVQALLVLHVCEGGDTALGPNVEGVGARQAGGLEHLVDLAAGGVLAVHGELVLLQADGAAQGEVVLAAVVEAAVAVVEDDLDVGRLHGGARPFLRVLACVYVGLRCSPTCSSAWRSSLLMFSYSSPSTKRTAEKKFVLPAPLRPTMTLLLGENDSVLTWFLYVLKPWIVMCLMWPMAAARRQARCGASVLPARFGLVHAPGP
jgi:hypothetical protein